MPIAFHICFFFNFLEIMEMESCVAPTVAILLPHFTAQWTQPCMWQWSPVPTEEQDGVSE